MNTWIALFRGINVGGNNVVKMADLKQSLASLNLKNVRTYIQSGNVVFESAVKSADSLKSKIKRRVESEYGFRPQICLIYRDAMVAAVKSNPFPEAESDPKSLHFYFLSKPATDPNTKALSDVASQSERYGLTDHVFYLYAPDGIGRSKLAATAEKHLGVATTARNYRTVNKVLELSLPLQ